MLAVLLTNKIRSVREVSLGLCVIIVITEFCQRGVRQDTRFIITTVNNHLIFLFLSVLNILFFGLIFF